MRDAIITLLVFGSVPLILRSPMIGILVWSWLAYMNPHRLCWGFASTMPFSMVVALSTLLSVLFTKQDKKIPWTGEVIVLALFVAWMFITTVFALDPDDAWEQWSKVWKIQLVTFLTLMVMKDVKGLHLLVWAIAASLGFYGVKGGIFTILSGGGYKVWGPDGTFIGGNNEIGLALIMTLPLIRYLQMSSKPIWLRNGLLGAICLCVVSIFGTHSRGALMGVVAVIFFLVMKGKNRFLYTLLAVVGGVILFQFMPDSWHERMGTISSYEKDGSAMGRLNAWQFATNLAMDRLFGGGFEAFSPALFKLYAPNPNDFHDAHSIYFEVLGEHGFIGLALFLLLGGMTWLSSVRTIKAIGNNPELAQVADLLRMVQASLVGYAVSGAFLGMAYFDLYYALIAIVVMSGYVVKRHVVTVGAPTVVNPTIKNPTPRNRPRQRDFVRKPIGYD